MVVSVVVARGYKYFIFFIIFLLQFDISMLFYMQVVKQTSTYFGGNKMITREQRMCEDATGVRQQGKLQFWNKDGQKITCKQAKEEIYKGNSIAVPGAGAGNYRRVFSLLGFTDVKVINWTSSAGDWEFGVKDETGWRIACQSNRYPYYGYEYTIYTEQDGYWGYETFEDLCEVLDN
jgi:hypothetical protein